MRCCNIIGRPALDGDVIASYVGDGAPALVRRAIGDTDDEAPFRAAYGVFSWLLPHPQASTTPRFIRGDRGGTSEPG